MKIIALHGHHMCGECHTHLHIERHDDGLGYLVAQCLTIRYPDGKCPMHGIRLRLPLTYIECEVIE